ncbi:14030_t:CDS:2 [Cetraspora pellucida]|uniref:14030_t:CDS:1 n=1 Tax=Cetraspora pellucida TaxID=1433469 RepID=A0A9N9D3V9_9GLOM|nr:14030_t:CDS:2 [Cetraspora pellucida]
MLSSKYFLKIALLCLLFDNLASAQDPPKDLYKAESILDGHIDVNLCHWLLEYHFTWACLSYLAVNRTTIPDPACKSFAAISTALTLFHRLTVASISIITYLRQKICDTGIYDWKIFLPVITISSIVSIIALDSYGPVTFWCAAKTDTIITPIASICTTFIVLSICLFCYIQTIQAIRSIKKQHLAIIKRSVGNKPDNSTSVISEVEMKVSIKVSGYILVFILQWIPSVPYDIYSFLGRTHPWVYCMVIVSVCMGSVGNAIFYVINEGWNRYGSSNFSSSDQATLENANSSKDGSDGPLTITCSIDYRLIERKYEVMRVMSYEVIDCSIINRIVY